MIRLICLALSALTLAAPATAACAPAASAEGPRTAILLINRPALWPAPGAATPGAAAALTAGERLPIVATRPAPAAGGAQEPAMTWYQVKAGTGQGWLPAAYLDVATSVTAAHALAAIGQETVDQHQGLAPEYAPADLAAVGPVYEKQNEGKIKMRKEAAEALTRMIAGAKADGVSLLVVSGYRSWAKQQGLYEHRVRETGPGQKTVAKPGHSEHQLGTAADLTDGDAEHLLRESFGQTPAGQWLRAHAWEYGFAISFTTHNQPQTGIAPEPWHYRYWGLNLARAKHRAALGEAAAPQQPE